MPAKPLNMKFHEDVIMPEMEFPIKYFSYGSEEEGLHCNLHWHKELELVHVLEGKLVTHVGEMDFVSEKGETAFVNSNELHGYTIHEGPFSIFVVLIDLPLIQGRFIGAEDSLYLTPLMNQAMRVSNALPKDTELERCFGGLIRENARRTPGYQYAVKSYVFALIARLLRAYTPDLPRMDSSKHASHRLAQVNRAIRYLEANYAQDINLSAVADLVSLSKPHLCRIFKQTTGVTLVNYLNHLRIHQSLALLANRHLTVTDIAIEVGFGDSNYFSRVFHDIMRVPPSKYRKNIGRP